MISLQPVIGAYVGEDFQRIKSLKALLSDDELTKLQRTVAESGGSQSDLETFLDSGQFLRQMPHLIGKLICEYPALFLDNLVFNLPTTMSRLDCQIGKE